MQLRKKLYDNCHSSVQSMCYIPSGVHSNIAGIRTSSLAVKIGDYIVRPGEAVHHHIESNLGK